jgi:hypothetical protein
MTLGETQPWGTIGYEHNGGPGDGHHMTKFRCKVRRWRGHQVNF